MALPESKTGVPQPAPCDAGIFQIPVRISARAQPLMPCSYHSRMTAKCPGRIYTVFAGRFGHFFTQNLYKERLKMRIFEIISRNSNI